MKHTNPYQAYLARAASKKAKRASAAQKTVALLGLLTLAACGGGSVTETSADNNSNTPTPNEPSNNDNLAAAVEYTVIADDAADNGTKIWSEGGSNISSETDWAQFLTDNGLETTESVDFRLYDVLAYRKQTSSSCGKVAFKELRLARAEELSSGQTKKLLFTSAVDAEGMSASTDVSCLSDLRTKNVLVKVAKLGMPVEFREVALAP